MAGPSFSSHYRAFLLSVKRNKTWALCSNYGEKILNCPKSRIVSPKHFSIYNYFITNVERLDALMVWAADKISVLRRQGSVFDRRFCLDLCPIQGVSKTLISLTLQKPEISTASMGHLARKGFNYFTLWRLVWAVGKNSALRHQGSAFDPRFRRDWNICMTFLFAKPNSVFHPYEVNKTSTSFGW